MTRDEIKKVMAAVVILWPNATTAPRGYEALAVDVWMNMLGDLDCDAVLATLQIVASHEAGAFAPPVGTIRERTLSALAEASGTATADAGCAWAIVKIAVSRWGRDDRPRFPHGVTEQAVEQVGWRTICDSTNEGVTEAHFRRAYGSIAARSHRQMVMPPNVANVLDKVAASLQLGAGDAQ